ncbi:MAG: small subunit ribosomal protein S8, partial [Parcubacteria group bacterium Gr01-1014_33]
IPYSKFKHEIARALERAGFVTRLERKGKRVKKVLDIGLLFRDKKPMVEGVFFFSRPSRRRYVPYREIKFPRRGGIVVISTPKGVLTGKEARKEKVGGELIAEIW